MTGSETAASGEVAAPPYISFRTVLNLIEGMANEGIPPRIDRSYLSTLSGGYQGQVLAALRWLGFIDEGGNVQDRLIELVKSPRERQALIGNIVREKYPEAVALGEQNATQGQLEEEFRKSGIGGATLRKATTFYLHAAGFAGIPVSPFFKASSAPSGKRPAQRRKPRTTRQSSRTPSDPSGETANGTLGSLRLRYIEMLMKKAEEEMDEGLLDRIESLLGYGEGSGPTVETGPKTSIE